ncbi:restriction endonuclease subunit S [uncultured Anaerovibrio sp.]|uniref:restriction endonuclease subunit S n=1 Tax=uncultured Anaerovibrio sp. TaxID=361586 RepID=UPI0026025C1B|nr:restriction endonuclease subunit S [uncultured Anaerovibrio sp.]
MSKKQLTIEEKLQNALVPAEEQPYQVPDNWCWVRENAVLYNMESRKPSGEIFSYIDIDAIDNSRQEVLFPKTLPVSKAPSRASRKLHNGDTLFSLVRPYLMNIAYIDEELCKCIASTGFYVCSPRENVVNKWLYWFMVSPYTVYGLTTYMKGDNSPSIRGGDIEMFPLPLPPLPEQQRIVDRIESLFAKLDEAREKIQGVLDGAELRKAAILHQAFTGKLTANWRRTHGVSDDSWKEAKLGDVCKINPPKIDANKFNEDLEVSFIPMADVSDITGEITGYQTRKLSEVKNGFTNFQENDVVFAKITPCMENGKSAIIGKLKNDIGYGTTEFFVIRSSARIINKFVYHLVRSSEFRSKAKSNMSGAVGQQRVPKSFMQQYLIKLPTVPEQQEIVSLLDNLLAKERSIVSTCEKSLATIDTIKKSILARAFRGELGTNDPTEPSSINLLKEILNQPSS